MASPLIRPAHSTPPGADRAASVESIFTYSRHPAALRSAGRASRLWLRPRSCLRPARRCRRRRAPAVDRPEGHETRTKPAASRGCLRRGRSDSGMEGAPFASAGRSVVSVVGLPSRPPSTQAEPSSRGPGRQGRSYSGALHLDALNHDRSTVCGSKADGMGAGVSGGHGSQAHAPDAHGVLIENA